jgi:hypothetical protein
MISSYCEIQEDYDNISYTIIVIQAQVQNKVRFGENDRNHVSCVYCNFADIPFVRTIAETLDN